VLYADIAYETCFFISFKDKAPAGLQSSTEEMARSKNVGGILEYIRMEKL
jgi:hypothetical protein